MNNKNYDPVKIELALNDLLVSGGVLSAKNIFPGKRPEKDVTDGEFIVVSTPTDIIDMNAYGKSISQIEIYVRKMANGRKNVQRLTELFDHIFDLLPFSTPEYDFDLQGTLSDSDNLGYDVTMILLQTLTKTTN